MTTVHYKRLVLELCHACRRRDSAAIERLITSDFTDNGRPARPDVLHSDVEIFGLLGEGHTVVLRTRSRGREQVQIFEGRDDRLAMCRTYLHRPL